MNFDQVFPLVIDTEGGHSLDRMDSGNWTGGQVGVGELKGSKYGISAASYPELNIGALTIDQAREIYRVDFWQRLRADELPAWLRYPLFDFAVNSGVGKAAEELQGCVGVLRDGKIGPKTLMAVRAADPKELFRLLFVERAMVFALSPNDRRYGRSWYGRLFDTTFIGVKELATP